MHMTASPSRSFWSRALDVASLVATPLSPTDYLELVLPLRASRGADARIARIESVWDETKDARTLTLRPGRGWRAHRAGQFVRVSAPVDGRVMTRTYSITSSADRADGCITITVKAVQGGRMSRFLVRDAKPGDYVTLGLPQGDFVLPERPTEPLFITAGSGITPVMSMLRTFESRAAMPYAVHVHYAPSAREAILAPELGRIAAANPRYRFILVTTRERDQGGGRFERAQLDALVPDWRSREAWVCGPEGLLDAAEACFAAAGRAEHLHMERFRAKLAPAPANDAGGRVRFGLSKRDVEARGNESLLAVAEAAGVNAPHGCRMGICHSCDATMVSGCVRDLRTGHRIDEPGARVQVCVCAAAGDVEIAL
jgi:ferredoxin-NADP reductase